MVLFCAWKKLRQRGVLGINRRNADCILDQNPRSLFANVDNKLQMHNLCRRIGVPTPEIAAIIDSHRAIRRLGESLADADDFVLKPNRGAGGRGITVITGREGAAFVRSTGERLQLDDLRQRAADIVSGIYSFGNQPDSALIQYRVQLHAALAPYCFHGIPDVRVVLYRGEPAMAMLRLPTRASQGRSNLHQGGLGAGIDLATGSTFHAIQRERFIARHPDTGASLLGVAVPCWHEVLEMSRRVARAAGLGLVGVDIVIDARRGPMLLEANARPGLAIQLANNAGLLPRFAEIESRQASMPWTLKSSNAQCKVAAVRSQFGA